MRRTVKKKQGRKEMNESVKKQREINYKKSRFIIEDVEQLQYQEGYQQRDEELSMLVSNSETESFKLEFLISSYKQIIQQCKTDRKQFLELMRTQLQRHHHYFNQILQLVKSTQQHTKKYLKSQLQTYSNLYTVKISLLTAKLNSILKLTYSPETLKSNRISNFNLGCLLQKATSYQDSINFDHQLKEIYTLKQRQSFPDFIENHQVQQSLQKVKKILIKNWEYKSSKSFSFSSISNPQEIQDTFGKDQFVQKDNFVRKTQRTQNQSDKKLGRSLKNIYYCSNETDCTSKSKPNISVTHFKSKQQKQTE